jgi:hypothetical protein
VSSVFSAASSGILSLRRFELTGQFRAGFARLGRELSRFVALDQRTPHLLGLRLGACVSFRHLAAGCVGSLIRRVNFSAGHRFSTTPKPSLSR